MVRGSKFAASLKIAELPAYSTLQYFKLHTDAGLNHSLAHRAGPFFVITIESVAVPTAFRVPLIMIALAESSRTVTPG
jgi:hypothetical protein